MSRCEALLPHRIGETGEKRSLCHKYYCRYSAMTKIPLWPKYHYDQNTTFLPMPCGETTKNGSNPKIKFVFVIHLNLAKPVTNTLNKNLVDGPVNRDWTYKCKKITNIKRFHVNTFPTHLDHHSPFLNEPSLSSPWPRERGNWNSPSASSRA